MNRTLKRVLGLTGSAVLGVAGAVTFASAAQAHHVVVDGIVECTPEGGWTVVWQVTDWTEATDATGVITAVDAELNENSEIAVAAVLPKGAGNYLEGSQTFTSDVEYAEINIEALWTYADGTSVPGAGQGKVSAPEGGCAEEPPADPEPEVEVYGWVDCLGIYVEASNYNEEALAEFTFVSSDGEEVAATPEVDDYFSYFFAVTDPEAGLTVDAFVDGELWDTYTWVENELCGYATVESSCTDGLTFTLNVPADGEETTFYFYPDYNDEEIVEVVAPGGTATVNIPPANADEEFWVYYYIETPKDSVYGDTPWVPCDDETPPPSETPSAQPQLPTTGSSLTIMISSAAALIVAAAAIFLIMRRRRAAQDW
jgi:LPXTG-motif cell wall-anchored protein